MKKILWFALALAMTLAFVSCEEEGASMNEDYAGTWYMADGTDYYKSDQTDTSYEMSSWIAADSAYQPMMKGKITKVTDGELTSQMTEFYISAENTNGAATADDEGWYNKDAVIQWGIDEGLWTDEASMIAMTDLDFDEVTSYLYVLSSDGNTLTMTEKNDPTEIIIYVTVDPAQ